MRGGLLRLRIGRSTLRAEAIERGSVSWAGEATYTTGAELADAIARLAAEPPRACRRLTVVLDSPPVQLRILIDLPPVKSRHLAALVAQQAGRFFRKNGQPLATDAAWVGKGGTRVAHAAAVEEPLVEAIATGARAAGLWLDKIAPGDEGARLTLLPKSERESRERSAHSRTRRLTVATCGVWLAAGALFFGRLAWERRAVERELTALAQPLAAVLQARRELRDAETTLSAITAAERDRGLSLGLLAAVTGALPDSSVLTSFAWNAGGSGVLVGGARHATDVVARLDRLGTLAGVHLGGARGARVDRRKGVGAIHDLVREGAGSGKQGAGRIGIMTARDRRALLIGGGVVLGGFLLLRVLPWTVRSALAAEVGLRQRAALLARARADLAEASGLRDSAVALGQALVGLAPKILSGNSPAEAIADLSGRVNLAASRSQAKLERVDPLTDSAVAGRLHRVALRAAFECDIRGLVGMLQALTFGKAALAVRELRVTVVDASSADRIPEVLRVEMTVGGWFLESRESGNGKRETAP